MDQQASTAPVPPPVSSATTRMSNVFTSPGELYTEVAATPVQSSSWVLPLVVTILLTFVSTFAVYNNPSLRQQVFDMQEKAVQKMVSAGRVTQDQADRQLDLMKNSGPVMFVAFGGGVQAIGVALVFFVGALLVWLGAKMALKFGGGYGKIMEVEGLSMWIMILGTIVTIIMINLMNNVFASPGGGLLLGESFDPTNKGHKLLAALNVFTFWQVAVAGIGLAKISGKSTAMGMVVSFVVWAIIVVCLTMIF